MFTPAQLQPYIDQKLINAQQHPEDATLWIYNYTNKCQIDGAWDSVTEQCRGLILRHKDQYTAEVVANPFPKFFNLEERDHDIPSEEPQIYEKYDGSLGILYWIGDTPYIATRGSFTSDQARWATEWFRKYVPFQHFDPTFTYLFEVIYPENKIVVSYDFQGLVFLAKRHRFTGDEHWQDMPSPIQMPEKHPPMDLAKLKDLERDNAEGFVVLYPSTGLRIKLKFEEYKRLHRIVTNVTPRSIWDALRNENDLSEILERVPDEFYQWVKNWQAKLLGEFETEETSASHAKHAVEGMESRKEQALWLKENAPHHLPVVFAILDGKDYKQIIWRNLKPKAEDAFTQEI